jgi:hypothetical protein
MHASCWGHQHAWRDQLSWLCCGPCALQEILQKYEPRASVLPAQLNFMDCPYMWPFCAQPLYAGAMPLIFNATVLNGMGLIGAPRVPSKWTFLGMLCPWHVN